MSWYFEFVVNHQNTPQISLELIQPTIMSWNKPILWDDNLKISISPKHPTDILRVDTVGYCELEKAKLMSWYFEHFDFTKTPYRYL